MIKAGIAQLCPYKSFDVCQFQGGHRGVHLVKLVFTDIKIELKLNIKIDLKLLKISLQNEAYLICFVSWLKKVKLFLIRCGMKDTINLINSL